MHRVRCECEERRRQAESASSEAQALNSHLSQSQAAARVGWLGALVSVLVSVRFLPILIAATERKI